MAYEKPSFVEIKMDAEIGSYQADYDPLATPPVAPSAQADDEADRVYSRTALRAARCDRDAPRG